MIDLTLDLYIYLSLYGNKSREAISYVVNPAEAMGNGVGLDVALEVDVISGAQVVRVQITAQPHRHLWLI